MTIVIYRFIVYVILLASSFCVPCASGSQDTTTCRSINIALWGDNDVYDESVICYYYHNDWQTDIDNLNLSDKQWEWVNSLRPTEIEENSSEPRVRRSINSLTPAQFKSFADAVYNLKIDEVDGYPKYKLLMDIHVQNSHDMPTFAVWHRDFLLRFENALREYSSDLTIPYWDITADKYLPTPADSIVWSSNFFGNGKGIVSEGSFACWSTPEWNCSTSAVSGLVLGDGLLWRNVGSEGSLFGDNELQYMSQLDTYNLFSTEGYCVARLHGSIHNFIGGVFGQEERIAKLTELGCSSEFELLNTFWEPTFLFLHSYLDYIFHQYRAYIQSTDVESDWIDNTVYKNCDKLDDVAFSFKPLIMKDLISTYYEATYIYETRGLACQTDNDCATTADDIVEGSGSTYSWCSSQYRRCLNKIKDGGDCTALPDNACYSGECEQNVCKKGAIELRQVS